MAHVVAHDHSLRPLPLALAVLGTVMAAWAVIMAVVINDAQLPPRATGDAMVVFPRSFDGPSAFAAVIEAGGVVRRSTWFDNVQLVRSNEPGFVGRLQASGALAAFTPIGILPIATGGCSYLAPPAYPLFTRSGNAS